MKSKTICIFGIVLISILFLPACVWENLEELYPDTPECDTTSVSFSMHIMPILSNNCLGCHSNLNAPSFGGGLSFEDHEDVAEYSNRIIGAINHQAGFQAMPRGSDKLDNCSIKQFEAWVHDGAPDN